MLQLKALRRHWNWNQMMVSSWSLSLSLSCMFCPFILPCSWVFTAFAVGAIKKELAAAKKKVMTSLWDFVEYKCQQHLFGIAKYLFNFWNWNNRLLIDVTWRKKRTPRCSYSDRVRPIYPLKTSQNILFWVHNPSL